MERECTRCNAIFEAPLDEEICLDCQDFERWVDEHESMWLFRQRLETMVKTERTHFKCERGHAVYKYKPEGTSYERMLCPICDREELEKELTEELQRQNQPKG